MEKNLAANDFFLRIEVVSYYPEIMKNKTIP